MNNKEKTVQEMKWKITPNHKKSQCAKEVSGFNPDKHYCEENELPSTKIMTFKKKGKDVHQFKIIAQFFVSLF